MITEADKKITPRTWRQELAAVQASLDRTQKPYAELVTNLSAVEVLEYNRDDLNRMLANESRQKKQIAARVQNRREEAL